MKRFLKKLLLLAAVIAVLFVTILPGCTPAATPVSTPALTKAAQAPEVTKAPAQKVTLQFWTRLADNKQIEQVVNDFNAQNPNIEIVHQGIPGADYRTKLLASVAGGNPPDIVGMDVAIMPVYFGQNALLSLDDFMKVAGDSFIKDFGDGLFFSSRYQGKTYGIPWWTDPSLMIYNKSLLEKAGVAKVPETYEELLAAAKAITKTTGDPATEVYGAIFPVISAGVMFTWLPYLWGSGGDLVDDKGCAAFNNAAGEQSMKLWVDLFTQNYMPRSAVLGTSQDDLNKLFFSERAGFIVSGPGMVDQAKKINPNIQVAAALMPRPANGKSSSYLGGDNLVIMKNTKYPNEAWKFIQFMLDTKRMSSLALANNAIYVRGLPTRNSVLTPDFFAKYPYTQTVAEAAKIGRAPNTPFLTEARVPVYDAFQEALTGKKPIKQALADAEVKVNQITGCKK